MVQAYLQKLRALVDRVAPADGPGIECKHFFSGAAAYADGRIFLSLTPAGLALKLPKAARNSMADKGGTPLRYFPKAPVKKDYIVLPESVAADVSALGPWILSSIEFVKNPPEPPPGAKPPRPGRRRRRP